MTEYGDESDGLVQFKLCSVFRCEREGEREIYVRDTVSSNGITEITVT
jgi:hypothetical protein